MPVPGEADALKASGESFSLLFEQIESMVCTLDADGCFLTINPAGERLTGYAESELIGMEARELIAPELRERAREQFLARVGGTAPSEPDESVLVARDGTRVPIRVTSTILRDAGRATGVLGVVTDLSERRQAERALRQSEERFRNSFESAPIGMGLVGLDGRWLQVNQALSDFVGHSRDELLAATHAEITHPDDRDLDEVHLRRMLAGDSRTYQVEKRYLHKDGHAVWAVLGVSLVRAEDSTPLHLIAHVKDITERRRGQEEIERTAFLLAEAERIAHLGSWFRDLRSGEGSWSDEQFRIFGFDPTGPHPSRAEILARIHPDDVDRVVATVTAAEEAGQDFSFEYRCVLPDGEVRWVHSRGQTVVEAGRAVAARGTLQDITDQKRTEAERDRLRDELQRTQRLDAIGRLAGGVAHDFNNMLTAIRGYGELLLGRLDPGSAAHQEALQILRAAEQASALPRQLLAFSRRQALEPSFVDLNRVVSAATDLLRRVIGEALELRVTTDAAAAVSFVDAGQIEQALMNLALNARDAMPNGGTLTIATANVELGPAAAADHGVRGGRYVVLTVTDSGEGMDEETKAHAFEPFFTTKAHGEGTGLGLASVYGLVSQSGGFIRLESAPGRGTSFALHFPCAPDTEVVMEPPPATPLDQPVVLLAEDDALVRGLAARILERAGFHVLSAVDGDEALELHRRLPAPADVVVTDVVMPSMGGRELARRIRQSYPELPFVFMSGYSDEALTPETSGDERSSFLAKPFPAVALIGAVERALGRHVVERADPHAGRAAALTCLVADDHPAVLDSVTRFLESQGIDVVASVANGDDALLQIEALRPTIALLDVVMEPIDGIEVARRAAASTPETRVVLYTGHRDRALLAEALDAQIRGFVLKEAPLADLVRALATVRDGGTYVDPGLSSAIAAPRAVETLPPLTPREQEILALLADGLTNDKVAASLGISAETVQSHVGNAMGKLAADTRTEAVAKALRQSLIA